MRRDSTKCARTSGRSQKARLCNASGRIERFPTKRERRLLCWQRRLAMRRVFIEACSDEKEDKSGVRVLRVCGNASRRSISWSVAQEAAEPGCTSRRACRTSLTRCYPPLLAFSTVLLLRPPHDLIALLPALSPFPLLPVPPCRARSRFIPASPRERPGAACLQIPLARYRSARTRTRE